ncbi:Nn.00g024080.m01.CDS01 [Neocucurbitaria sp. VM-36]
MSSPQYQVILRVYNIDKTKLTSTTRPTIYTDVNVANKVALEWLRDFRSEDEVVQIIRDKEFGMREYAASNLKGDNHISAWAEVVMIADAK